jgi:hypothetical protein
MKPLGRLNFNAEAFSPPVDRNFRGIKIAFSTDPIPSTWPNLQIGIVYFLDDAFAKTLGNKYPAEALVLTVISGYQIFSENILRDALLFEDDYRRKDELWFGHVNFNVTDFLKLSAGREYYFTVSMGTWISNTLHISREKPQTEI